MKIRAPNLAWVGLALGVAFWLLEAALHATVFGSGTFGQTLVGEHDPNEIWMRLVIVVLFVGFGAVAERSVRAERRAKEDALRIHRLVGYVDRVKNSLTHSAGGEPAGAPGGAAGAPAGKALLDEESSVLSDLEAENDEIAALARMVQDLSSYLDVRFRELYALLQLTHQINLGLLLDDVLDKAFSTLRTVIPFDRLSVALLEDGGRVVRARWARSDGAPMRLKKGFSAPLAGSSLQGILASGEPRILNDLARYLEEHPRSESTRLMVAEGIRSSLTCPLVSMGKPIGFCFFSSRTPDTYRDAHVEVFRLIAGHLSVVVEKGDLYEAVLREKETSETLLLNVMPARIATRLKAGEKAIAESLASTAVLFADVVGFTDRAGRHPPEAVVRLLEDLFGRFDRASDAFEVEKIKTIGDAYMATGGPAPGEGAGSLARMAEFALGLLEAAREVRWPDGDPVRVRIGLHLGPAVAGVIGQKKFAYDVWGDTVNLASRMVTTGEPDRIHVTDEVHARLLHAFDFEPRGETVVKGKGPLRTWFLTGRSAAAATGPQGSTPPPPLTRT